ncbi:unnamed protein product [Mesocestoides corti]|uniref:Transposase n=1 Tax=Mesocestoides corti TaxID=53468 RepID=A0A0R3UNU0_MESCO|nr:unnamed protein product [Mesocestoides corti]
MYLVWENFASQVQEGLLGRGNNVRWSGVVTQHQHDLSASLIDQLLRSVCSIVGCSVVQPPSGHQFPRRRNKVHP